MFLLIAVNDTSAWWVQVVLYLSVLITLVSGADYFLNFRRTIDEARERMVREAADRAAARQREPAP